MTVKIREAGSGDEEVIAGLVRELAEFEGEDSPLTAGYVKEYLAYPGSFILLAEEDGQALGLLSYGLRPNLFHAASSGSIEELIVRKGRRQGGVGSALMIEAMRRMQAAGCAEVSVSTISGNTPAQRFYRSHGLVDEAVLLEKHF